MREIQRFKKYKNFTPVFSGSFIENIQERLRPGIPFLITTRLDNDDALNIRAIAAIQDQFRPYERIALNFPNGFCYYNQKLFLSRQLSNPFLSLIERIHWNKGQPEIHSVMGRKHMEMAKLAPIRQLNGEPMWLQVVHQNNLSNRPKGKATGLTLNAVRKRFGI